AARGGWAEPSVLAAFARYTRVVGAALGDLVSYWAPINEPTVYAVGSYGRGAWPPGKRDPLLVARVTGHMLRAHGLAHDILHRQAGGRAIQVGLLHNMHQFEAHNPHSPADRLVAALAHRWLNLAAPRALLDGRFRFPFAGLGGVPEAAGTMDFFGLNY